MTTPIIPPNDSLVNPEAADPLPPPVPTWRSAQDLNPAYLFALWQAADKLARAEHAAALALAGSSTPRGPEWQAASECRAIYRIICYRLLGAGEDGAR